MIHISAYGRLGRDPEQRTTANGNTMAFVSMAVDVTRKDGDRDSEWFRLVAFDALLRHRKGDLVGVMGTLTRERWTGNDGQERTSWSVMIDALMSVQAVRPKGGGKRSENGRPAAMRHNNGSYQAPLKDDIPI